jgi:REP element-mobilizing transposase RayT
MSRLRRIADRDRVFFVTTNLDARQEKLSEKERDIVLDAVHELRDRGAFKLFGYAVMPDHAHILLVPDLSGLSTAIRDIKRISAYRIIGRGIRNKSSLWQPRYFDNIVRRLGSFWEKLEYIHNNPVEAGLVARPEDWKWSSYAAYAPKSKSAMVGLPPVPVDPFDFPADENGLLWPAPHR